MQWKIADVQWSPFAARDYWVASTANQKALVWNLMLPERKSSVQHTLNAHTRAITDINFSAHHPDIISTCAVDGYVNCWDLREPKRPVMTFVDWFAGATQVKWNRQDPHILASSHDRWLRIWDERKGAHPLRSIEAHESKIYGVDWNRTRCTGIATCSLDKSIKFWDYSNNEDEPERIIRTDFPVWRARHTPFGWGLLAMPQNSPGDLHLFDRRRQEEDLSDSATPAVKVFSGHGDSQVKEFLWRSRGDVSDDGIDNREFQLVSWGDDKYLRLQHVPSELLEGVGYVKGSQIRKRLNVTRKGAIYKTFRNVNKSAEDDKPVSVCLPNFEAHYINPNILSSSIAKSTNPASTIKTPSSLAGTKAAPVKKRQKMTAMKRKPGTKKSDDKGQIDWMSGIRWNKKPESPMLERNDTPTRRFSYIARKFDPDAWDSSESLHDEIIRVHDQYSKVKFPDVNMDKQVATATMDGPWGENGQQTYLKVEIDFPEGYPASKPPRFKIAKTSSIPQETFEKITRDIVSIAEGFSTRKQGCLEAIVCYLMGDIDLEESTIWLDDDMTDDNGIDDLGDESSSEDDDGDIPTGASASMSQELDANAGPEMLGPIHRNANVPLPRLCGAVFSNTGKLVCFFPPKTDSAKSLLPITETMDRSRGEHLFESFSRLVANSSPGPRSSKGLRSLASDSRASDSESTDSDESSSSDSDSSQYRPHGGYVGPRSRLWRQATARSFIKTLSTNHSQRSGSATGTGTGIMGSRARGSKARSVIAIHGGLPYTSSKLDLAAEYRIFGEGLEVCEHNAAAAEKHGYQDLADIWRYSALLLHNNIPLEILTRSDRGDPVFIIARDAVRDDEGIDTSYDKKEANLSGRVKWGHNPLAKHLIANLFKHFEQLADIQMLAMLSCVFSEPASDIRPEVLGEQPATPLAMKTPAFSLDYFPSDDLVWPSEPNSTNASRHPSHPSTPKISHTPLGIFGSFNSSNWGSDPAQSYSAGDTPPLRSQRNSSDKLREQVTQSLSTSPEDGRKFYRANSGLASSFAAFSKPFSMASSDPPGRKRPSPVEHMINTLSPGVTWGRDIVINSKDRKEVSDNEPLAAPVCTGVTVTLENQNVFDDEGCMSTALLDFSHTHLYSSYRRAYAEQLLLWGLPYSRLEILKFNALRDYFAENETVSAKTVPALSVKSNASEVTIQETRPHSPVPVPPPDQGLDIAGHCLRHDLQLQYKDGFGRCDRCNARKKELHCVICEQPVTANYICCLSCGCVTHGTCLAAWPEDVCPGGCDCVCTESASQGVVESWEVLKGAIQKLKDEEKDEEEWDFTNMGSKRAGSATRGAQKTTEMRLLFGPK